MQKEQAPSGSRIPEVSATDYRLLVDSIKDYAIFMLDRDGHVTTWNGGAQRIKGYEPHEIIGKHFRTFYPKDVADKGWPEHELRVAAEVGRFEDDGWRIRKDGTRFWANVVITALRGSTGELRGFAKITRDLTARREQEDELRRSEERFRLMVEGVTDHAMFMLDPEGRVATWNSGAKRIKGYEAHEIIGKHFRNFYPKEVRDSRWPEHELQVAQTGRAVRGRGLAHPQGWIAVLGQRHHHCATRPGGPSSGVRQADAGPV